MPDKPDNIIVIWSNLLSLWAIFRICIYIYTCVCVHVLVISCYMQGKKNAPAEFEVIWEWDLYWTMPFILHSVTSQSVCVFVSETSNNKRQTRSPCMPLMYSGKQARCPAGRQVPTDKTNMHVMKHVWFQVQPACCIYECSICTHCTELLWRHIPASLSELLFCM